MENSLRNSDDNIMQEPEKIDLAKLFHGALKQFRKTWYLLLISVLIFAAVGFVKAKYTYQPMYKASASFVVASGDGSTSLIANNYYNRITTEQLTETFPYILTSGALRKIVASDLDVPVINSNISAQMLGETNLFQITVTDTDPDTAYEVLQSVIENYPKVAQYIIGNTTLTKIEDTGVPSNPENQIDYKSAMVHMAFIGVLLYLVFLAILVLTRKTVRNRKELKKYLSIDSLGDIPQITFKRRASRKEYNLLVDNPMTASHFKESIESVTMHLRSKAKEHNWKVFIATSAMAGEGKTTCACNVALMLAQKEKKVLLIDGDLRNPSVMEHFFTEKKENPGLVECLKGNAIAEDILIRYKDTSLDLLPGGNPSHKNNGMWADDKFKTLVDSFRESYDYIIIDSPPCTFMNDTSLELPASDASILVIRYDYAPILRITNAADIITSTDTPMTGYIMNGQAATGSSYGYGNGYGRYGRYGRYGKYGTYGSEH